MYNNNVTLRDIHKIYKIEDTGIMSLARVSLKILNGRYNIQIYAKNMAII